MLGGQLVQLPADLGLPLLIVLEGGLPLVVPGRWPPPSGFHALFQGLQLLFVQVGGNGGSNVAAAICNASSTLPPRCSTPRPGGGSERQILEKHNDTYKKDR